MLLLMRLSFSYTPLATHVLSGYPLQFAGIRLCAADHYYAPDDATPVQGWSSLIVVVLVLGGVQ